MLLAFCGWPQSGKNSAVDYLVKNYGYQDLALNEVLLDACRALNPIVDFSMYGEDFIHFNEALEERGYEGAKKNNYDFRPFMQRLGTEFAEALGHPEMWIKLLMERMDKNAPGHAMSSCRRRVEAQEVRLNGGKMVRVVRPGNLPPNDHPVERELDFYPYDAMIVNDGTLDDLHRKVDNVLRGFLGATPRPLTPPRLPRMGLNEAWGRVAT